MSVENEKNTIYVSSQTSFRFQCLNCAKDFIACSSFIPTDCNREHDHFQTCNDNSPEYKLFSNNCILRKAIEMMFMIVTTSTIISQKRGVFDMGVVARKIKTWFIFEEQINRDFIANTTRNLATLNAIAAENGLTLVIIRDNNINEIFNWIAHYFIVSGCEISAEIKEKLSNIVFGGIENALIDNYNAIIGQSGEKIEKNTRSYLIPHQYIKDVALTIKDVVNHLMAMDEFLAKNKISYLPADNARRIIVLRHLIRSFN